MTPAQLVDQLAADSITLTATPHNTIRAHGTLTDHHRTLITTHKDALLDWLRFTCHTCHHPAAVFDSTGTPWCAEHMPVTDPAIRAAIVTLAQLGPLTLEEQAS